MNNHMQLLSEFFKTIQEDPRINATHISIYAALMNCWQEHLFQNPISIFSYQVMKLAKISGSATYHKSIKELHEYGYIKYVPSFNHFLGSQVYIQNL
jgi:hypothetical protein